MPPAWAPNPIRAADERLELRAECQPALESQGLGGALSHSISLSHALSLSPSLFYFHSHLLTPLPVSRISPHTGFFFMIYQVFVAADQILCSLLCWMLINTPLVPALVFFSLFFLHHSCFGGECCDSVSTPSAQLCLLNHADIHSQPPNLHLPHHLPHLLFPWQQGCRKTKLDRREVVSAQVLVLQCAHAAAVARSD